MANQLNKVFDPLSLLINEKDKVWLEQFFNQVKRSILQMCEFCCGWGISNLTSFSLHKQTVNIAVELREPIYMHVAAKYIQHEQVLQSMERVNWEVKEIMSQHNLYVDQLIQDLYVFRLKETDLIQFGRKLSSESASQILWNQVLKLVNFIFIDGFATKKCTPEGRALMQVCHSIFFVSSKNVRTLFLT